MSQNTDQFTILNPTLLENGRTLVLTLNHGKANEMGSNTLHAWTEVTKALHAGEIRSVITTSQRLSRSGKPIFIAGADVTERTGWSNEQVKAHVRWQRETLADLRKAPVFHCALVHGVALGWGTEFLLCCDYRIGTPTARFGLPETSLGILPGAGGTTELWMEIGIAHAMRLGMTGEQIDSDEAVRIGLIQEVSENYESGFDRALTLCQLANRRSPSALSAFKSALLMARGLTSSERLGLEATAYEHCVDSGDAAVGRAHFKEIIKGQTPPWSPFQSFAPASKKDDSCC
jgi:enoyl-CoA hydratase/carnithine racemase